MNTLGRPNCATSVLAGAAFCVAVWMPSLAGCGSSDSPEPQAQPKSQASPDAGGSAPGLKFGDDAGAKSACDEGSLDVEGCSCVVGAAPRSCYPGPASQAGVEACTKGTQSCTAKAGGELKTGLWGACEGAGQPLTCATAGKSCGQISDGCGGQLDCGPCPDCVAGTQTFTTPGVFDFALPDFDTLDVEVWGAGGGGKAYGSIENPTDGGDSSFNGTVVAGGGKSGLARTGGKASGGTTNLNGTDAAPACDQGYPVLCGIGPSGSSPNGGKGVASVALDGCSGGDGKDGEGPGGGGGATWTCQGTWWLGTGWGYSGAGGGGGAYASAKYAKGQLTGSVKLVVGAGGMGAKGALSSGAAGKGKNPGYYTGGNGANGRVTLTWTCP